MVYKQVQHMMILIKTFKIRTYKRRKGFQQILNWQKKAFLKND